VLVHPPLEVRALLMGLTIYESDSPEQMTNLEALHAMWSSEVKTMKELFPDPHGDRIQLVSSDTHRHNHGILSRVASHSFYGGLCYLGAPFVASMPNRFVRSATWTARVALTNSRRQDGETGQRWLRWHSVISCPRGTVAWGFSGAMGALVCASHT
jgi:hypothetical protein